jgi:hypothetical protein
LGLSFSADAPDDLTLERLTDSNEQSIDEEALVKAVVSGVEQANNQLGTAYHLKRIQYVPTDTPDLEIYSYLARMIVERLAVNAEFEGVLHASDLGWSAVPNPSANVQHPV